jgi:hypothetical protein
MMAPMLALLLLVALQDVPRSDANPDPFAPLTIYDGTWSIRADHPWSGAAPGAVDRLISRCRRFTVYFACEQAVNGKPQGLLIYSAGAKAGQLYSRFIAPDGLAGGRGDLTLDGSHWTYLDKPPATLQGKWSRVENFIVDHNHIRFEEYESGDEGKTWTRTNSGVEERIS